MSGTLRTLVTLSLSLAGCGRVSFEAIAPDGGDGDGGDGDARPPTYAETVLADGPVAYYRLGDPVGSTTAVDASGNGFDAVYASSGASAVVALGKPGALAGDADTAVMLVGEGNAGDGSTAKVRVPPAVLDFAGDFTVEGWVLPTPPPSGYNNCFFLAEDYLVSGFRTGWGPNLQPTMWTVESGGTSGIDSPVAMTASTWHHLVFVREGASGRIYLDGVQVITGPLDLVTPVPRMVTALGSESGIPTGNQFDELALYARALDATTIAAHHRAGR